jgi:hypothetical protein
MVAVGVAYARFVHPSLPTLAKAAAGAVVLLASSVAFDMAADFIERDTVARVLVGAVEERGKLVGVTFLIWAALDLAIRNFADKAPSRLPRAVAR